MLVACGVLCLVATASISAQGARPGALDPGTTELNVRALGLFSSSYSPPSPPRAPMPCGGRGTLIQNEQDPSLCLRGVGGGTSAVRKDDLRGKNEHETEKHPSRKRSEATFSVKCFSRG